MLLGIYSKSYWEVTVMKLLTFLCLILLGAAGCSGPTVLERDYGNSWAYNEAVQIVNPQAALVQTPATGMDPTSAKTVMEGYAKSFERKKNEDKSSTFINVGGSK
jgi:hypothetical protein